MKDIMVLDCTLRDGGYCNEWKFGRDNCKKIIGNLIEAKVEIIECGFLTEKINYVVGNTKFTSLSQITDILPITMDKKLVVMINYGEYQVDKLPECADTSLYGIRVAFHKKDLPPALEYCRQVKKKGYKVFMQPMVSLNYSEEEFLNLIEETNEIEPYAFYIVDSFGMMKKQDMIRLFYLAEHRLKDTIHIGFHSHNNMQMAFANAQTLAEIPSNRRLIVDTSIMGMGRGAGNLNTELFVGYLKDNFEANYQLKPLLRVIDEVLNSFYTRNYWGYSLPNYLSATYNTHPNYAGYLSDKNALTVENMEEIFAMMSDEKRCDFDKEYIEELYLRYMEKEPSNQTHFEELCDALRGKRVLVIAPGKSIKDECEVIERELKAPDIVSIGINADYSAYDTDYIFVSNIRRFRDIPKDKYYKCIITSNISADGVYMQTEYCKLLNDVELVKDNAGLMLIKFLIQSGVEKILLAGMDGYSHDADENYAENRMMLISQTAVWDAMNAGMSKVLERFSREVEISFITKKRHIGKI